MTPSQPTAVGIVEKVLSLSEDERLLQSFALLATVRESLDKNNGEFPKLPVLPLHSPPATTGRKKNWDDEKKNGGEEENQNCKTATSLVSDDDFIFAMRNLLNEEFHWKGKLRGLKEGQALLNSPIHAEKFEKLELTARKLHFAKSSLTSELDWVFAQVAFGITTSYRREPNGTLSLKLEGELNDVPLFEQLAVLREIDFYSLWAPFMTESKTLMQVNKIELLGWFKIAVPIFGLVRDAVFHAFGCDCMKEDGTIMLVAESIEAENAKNLGLCKVPEAPKGIGKARIFIHSFSGLVEVKSPVSARTRLIANLDPKIALPQALIDFAMKKMAGILLYVMQKMSKKVVKDPICSHAVRIREDREFYQDWLLPKFDEYCSLRQWDMSPVAALEYGKDEMEKVDVCGDGGVDGNLSPGKKKRNIIYRGGHKIRKRIRQRKQREVEEEIAALKLEGENNSYDMPHLLSPEFRDRYISWSARKIELDRKLEDTAGETTLKLSKTEILFESVFFLLVSTSFLSFLVINKFLGATFADLINHYFGVVGVVLLYNCKFCAGNSCVYFLAFTALQSKDSRRRQTLFNTRIFGMLAISVIFSLLTLVFSLGGIARGWVEDFVGSDVETSDRSSLLLERIATCQILFSTVFAVLIIIATIFASR